MRDAEIAIQKERLGTAHAVRTPREAIARNVTIFSSSSRIRLWFAGDFAAMREALAGRPETPSPPWDSRQNSLPAMEGFILEDGALKAIRGPRRERGERENHNLQRRSDGARRAPRGSASRCHRLVIARRILPDRHRRRRQIAVCAPPAITAEDEALGVNDRAQLAAAESILQARLRAKAMREGATLIDPSSVTLAFDTRLGRDAVVEPHVVFGPGVNVGEGSRIRSFSYLEGAVVGSVGPFAVAAAPASRTTCTSAISSR